MAAIIITFSHHDADFDFVAFIFRYVKIAKTCFGLQLSALFLVSCTCWFLLLKYRRPSNQCMVYLLCVQNVALPGLSQNSASVSFGLHHYVISISGKFIAGFFGASFNSTQTDVVIFASVLGISTSRFTKC